MIVHGLADIERAFGDMGGSFLECLSPLHREAESLCQVIARTVIAPEFQSTHPRRRIPGGNSNARLRKKRQDFLWRWWLSAR